MTTPTNTVPTEPTPEMLEPFARVLCSSMNIDPDEPEAPHGEWPTWYGQCAPLAAAYRAMLAAAPDPLPQGDLREAVARVIDPWAFGAPANIHHIVRNSADRDQAFAKADAILALLTPARSGCKLAAEYEDWQPLPEAPSVGGEDV